MFDRAGRLTERDLLRLKWQLCENECQERKFTTLFSQLSGPLKDSQSRNLPLGVDVFDLSGQQDYTQLAADTKTSQLNAFTKRFSGIRSQMKNRFTKNRTSTTSNASGGGDGLDHGAVNGVKSKGNDLDDTRSESGLDLPIPRKNSMDLLNAYTQVSSKLDVECA